MSTKGTIFLTHKNEHCYEETSERDNGFFRIYLEIAKENISNIYYDDYDGLMIGIKGDSEIANFLRKAR